METALVLAVGGFMRTHLVKRLKKESYWVCGVDLKYPKYSPTQADYFAIGDQKDFIIVRKVMFLKDQNICLQDRLMIAVECKNSFDEVY